ncbi:MAG: hypothetical protein KGL39_23685 [Patescibacteria group bacterium]|nr:hypothetical protein [Patescibacteria group bacterium]
MSDTPSSESNAPLNEVSAAAEIAALLDPPEKKQEGVEEPQNAEPSNEEVEAEQPEQEEAADPGADTVTIEVDGKTVELTKEQLADAYKNGLRQSDYTKKTMEVAEQRKAAEAEVAKAREERTAYANNLQKIAAQLEGALEQQKDINWQELLQSDPMEYLRQQHLFNQRQAALQQNQQEQQRVSQIQQAEAQEALQRTLADEAAKLIERIPEWKDEAKAREGKKAVAEYMKAAGVRDEVIANISNHLPILFAHKAMMYDQMMQKASAAAKKVAAAPQKVVKPGVGDSPRVDGRTAAMKNLQKTGRVEDAAAVFSQFL